MGDYLTLAPTLITSIILGYLLGAIPLADQLSRRYGVNIFTEGSGLAGSSNVLHSVGKLPAILVLTGDMGKGAIIIISAGMLGIDDTLQIIPLTASVIGHWKSVFSKFRGGDGLATLGGGAIALFGMIGMISTAIAMLTSLGGQRLPYSSLLGIVLGYISLVILTTISQNGQVTLTIGFGATSILVLLYSINGHRSRNSLPQFDSTNAGVGRF